LYITPVVFYYMDKFQEKVSGWLGNRKINAIDEISE